jgi:hypothetical protein
MLRGFVGALAAVSYTAWAIPVAAGAERHDLAPERTSDTAACIVFSDTFTRSRLDNWFRVAGDWTAEHGKLIGKGAGGNVDAWIYASSHRRSRSPIRIDVDVEFVQGNAEIVMNSTGHWQNEYRVTFWSMENHDYPNSYQLARYRDGEITALTDGTDGNVVTTVPISQDAHLAVTRRGNTIRIYVDGIQVDSITDPEPLPAVGTFGLGVVWDYTAAFDNFVASTGPCVQRKIES